jgi:ABC-type branched-subunit amino acid transport system substrate-binding protein
MTQYILNHYGHPSTFALVGVQGDVGDSANKGMKQALKGTGGTVHYLPENPGTTDFGPMVSQLKGINASWVFLILTNTDTGNLLAAMRRQGYTPHTAAWPGMEAESYLKAYGDISEGMIVAEETASLSSDDPKVREFIKQYQSVTGRMPGKFEELGWGEAELTVEALKQAKHLTRECVVEALDNIKSYKTGIYPPITFGKKTRQGVNAVGLVKIENSKTVEVAPFRSVK